MKKSGYYSLIYKKIKLIIISQLELLIDNSEWQITNTTMKRNMKVYECCPDSFYPDITIDIVLNRISPSYKAIIVTPAFGKKSFLIFMLLIV